jgi:hypothetical protein
VRRALEVHLETTRAHLTQHTSPLDVYTPSFTPEGHGAWEDATAKVRFQVFWKKLDEWAADIYAYAVDRVWVGDVVTLSQLREGDDGDREDACA